MPTIDEAEPGRVRPRIVSPRRAVELGAVLSSAVFAFCASRLWFFGDDWDFLLHRSVLGDGDRGLLEPHNGHWSTSPIIVFRSIFAFVGLGHYLPYVLPAILCHALIGLLLFTVLRATKLSEWNAALVALIVLIMGGGVGAQNTLWDFQIGFLGPGVLGLFSIHTLIRSRDRRALGLAAAAMVLGLTFSGTALVMTVWVGIFAWLAYGRRVALVVIGPAVTIYPTWFLLFARGHFIPHGDMRLVPRLFVNGIDSVWANVTFVPGTGWLMLVVLVGAVVAERPRRRAFALAAGGIVALLFAYVVFSYVGTRFGPSAATQSRYWYYGLLLSSPAGAVLLNRIFLWRPGRVRFPAVWWVAALGTCAAIGLLYTVAWTRQFEESVGDLPEVAVAANRIADADEQLLGDRPEPRLNPDLTVSALRSGPGQTLPDLSPSRAAEVDARASLQVSLTSDQPPWRTSTGSSEADASIFSCATASPRSRRPFSVPVHAPGTTVQIRASRNAVIQTRISSRGAESTPHLWLVPAHRTRFVTSTATGFVLEITVTAGAADVCPAG